MKHRKAQPSHQCPVAVRVLEIKRQVLRIFIDTLLVCVHHYWHYGLIGNGQVASRRRDYAM